MKKRCKHSHTKPSHVQIVLFSYYVCRDAKNYSSMQRCKSLMHHSPNLLTFNHFQVIICFCWGLCVTNKFLFFQGLSCGPSGYFLLHGLERIIRLLLSLGSLLCLGPSPTSERSLIMRLPQWEHKQKISPDAVFICKYMYICETLSIYVYMYVYLYKFMF